jgi:S1-C subfamily serine protease
VLVDRVDEDGVAAAAGLGPGMLIRGVGRSDVKSVAEFAAALEKESAADGVWLKVRTPRGNVPLLLQRK